MSEDKPQLLMFAKGYHGDKLFGGAIHKLTDIEQFNILFLAIRNKPIDFIEDYFGGIQLKQNQSAKKIQTLGRHYISKRNVRELAIPTGGTTPHPTLRRRAGFATIV